MSDSIRNKRTLIVCALEVETQGQLDEYDVLYTGVGKVNAAIRLQQRIGKYGSHTVSYTHLTLPTILLV